MFRRWINLLILVSLCLSGTAVLAQGQTCPEIVRAALDETDEQCSTTGRNQVCYGNVNLEAAPQPGIQEFNFSVPGDRVAVSAVESLSLSSRIEADSAWGVALMQLQANLPGSLPGQNVTFLLFGAVEITNAVETNTESVTFAITALRDVNLYEAPSTSSPLVANLRASDSFTVVGRSADASWLYLSESDRSGWVAAEDVQPEGEIPTLNILGPEGLPPTPMQAFYFQSGLGDAPCPEAPDSGLLVQTPEGTSQIEFTVNEVNITLGSTAYFQAQPGGEMTTSVLEGEATVESGGVSVVVPQGSLVRVPLDANGAAAGPPSDPEPYDAAKMAVLPIRVLPLDIDIAAPIAEGTAQPPSGGGLPAAGLWEWITGTIVLSSGCPQGMEEVLRVGFTPAGPVRLEDGEFDIAVLFLAAFGNPPPPGTVLSEPEPGTYVADFTDGGGIGRYSITVIDESHISGQMHYEQEGCAFDMPFEVTRIGD